MKTSHTHKLVQLCIAAALVTGCKSSQPIPADPSRSTADAQPAASDPVRSTDTFTPATHTIDAAFHLLQADLLESGGDRNVCLSPFSLEMALAMVAQGADEATLTEIRQAMGWPAEQQPAEIAQGVAATLPANDTLSGICESANSIWINRQLTQVHPAFIEANQKWLAAQVERLDFDAQAVGRINGWCAEHTHERIPQIIDQLSSSARMVLLNALYFKGGWRDPFDSLATRNEPFYLAESRSVQVPMMHKQAHLSYYRNDDCQIVGMPFESGNAMPRHTMYFVLPAPGYTPQQWLSQAHAAGWQQMLGQMRPREIRLTLPKFKAEYSVMLNPLLDRMGIRRAFNPAAHPFPGISDETISIDQALQKTFIEVNEQGAEAAAVTALIMRTTALMPGREPEAVTFDRPFLYAIVDNPTGSLLFVGTVADPTSGQ